MFATNANALAAREQRCNARLRSHRALCWSAHGAWTCSPERGPLANIASAIRGEILDAACHSHQNCGCALAVDDQVWFSCVKCLACWQVRGGRHVNQRPAPDAAQHGGEQDVHVKAAAPLQRPIGGALPVQRPPDVSRTDTLVELGTGSCRRPQKVFNQTLLVWHSLQQQPTPYDMLFSTCRVRLTGCAVKNAGRIAGHGFWLLAVAKIQGLREMRRRHASRATVWVAKATPTSVCQHRWDTRL